jgi:hypothetical protein
VCFIRTEMRLCLSLCMEERKKEKETKRVCVFVRKRVCMWLMYIGMH